MDPTEELKRAGSEALRFNAPLGDARALDAFGFINRSKPTVLVDLGCGRGSFLQGLVASDPMLRGVGWDLDAGAIAFAQTTAARSGLSDRVAFEVADATKFRGPVDGVVCIGSSHVFGGTAAMFDGLDQVVQHGVAVVGDGVWVSDPDEWCTSIFGAMPDGVEGLAKIAQRHGWSVEAVDLSSIEEWDSFEEQWCHGVRSVGTDQALRFAQQRTEDTNGTAGFLVSDGFIFNAKHGVKV